MAFTKVVGSGEVFHATVEPAFCPIGGTKPDPFTVSRNAPLPGKTLAGERLVIIGVPFCTLSMTNVAASDGPPGSGFDTVTAAIPAVATSDARTVTASCCVVEFKTLVRIDPFQKTCDGGLLTKPVPEMNIVNTWLPAVMLEGNRPVITGVGGGCEVLVLEQLPSSTVPIKSASNAVHRKRISRILL